MSVTFRTSLGDLKIELECEKVPLLAKNFLALCASGKFTGTKFHRNLRQFIIQGGDWEAKETGKEGRGGKALVSAETQEMLLPHQFHPELRHERRGTVSFADTGKEQKIGSQFFITYKRLPELDGRYSVVGRVIDGLDTLAKMEESPVVDEKKWRPVQDLKITEVIVHANPIAEGLDLDE